MAIVVASLGVGGYLLQTQSDLLIEQDKLAKLTPAARAAIERKQQIVLVATHWAPWALGALAALGFGLAVWGLVGWRRKQQELDAKDRVELGKLELERDKVHAELAEMQLSAAEKADEIAEQAEELVQDEVLEVLAQRADRRESSGRRDPDLPAFPRPGQEPTSVAEGHGDAAIGAGASWSSRRSELRERIGAVEETLADRLAGAYPTSALTRDVRPGPRSVNALLDDPDRRVFSLVDIKLTDPKNFLNRLQDSLLALSAATEILESRYPDKTIRSAAIFLFREGTKLPSDPERSVREYRAGLRHRPAVLIYPEAKWQEMTPERLRIDLEERWRRASVTGGLAV
ncbi:hypothetical protein [Amycolatopsis australiensis]|uniref:hypothetical protein n=1 Tax=Amycolatopsis australiensis TaxID=546364 RepID=UPI0011611BCF|nr:hypothetical protein [Amycolatopsis australiensis]